MRHMLDSEWNLGVYSMLDVAESANGAQFTRLTLGAEALGEDFDIRANAYLGLGAAAVELPHLLTASISGSHIVLTPTIEEMLQGFDAELGWRVPVFDSDSGSQIRAYAGGYHLASPSQARNGGHLRLELTTTEIASLGGAQLGLGGGLGQDNVMGTSAFASVSLRVPLGGAGQSAGGGNSQYQRMTTPFSRAEDIAVTQVSGPSEIAQTASGQAVTVLSDTAFGGGDLQNQLIAAGTNSTVVFVGDFTTSAPLQLQQGQTVQGAGAMEVRTASGKRLSVSLPGASVTGNFAGNLGRFEMADDSTLKGMTVGGTGTAFGSNPIGIYANNVSNAAIIDNIVSMTSTEGTAFGIRVQGSTNVLVDGNVVTATHPTANAVGIQLVGGSARISNNVATANGGSNSYAYFLVDDAGIAPMVLAGSTGNANLGGTCIVNTGTVHGVIEMVDGTSCP
ncbi:right-handed parallel beta-helix repeat-containing protein [Devosia ginsengisoli]|uniref:right-handed parallel beta-helix repeat-containing protein n=1 Tax=Devosia ginsengisoli TaxID=400770 RepID=UPI0026EC71BF|nr:right-handed parallel beta-helix repeat-containing protein [Devosia ginsengisoli]MCR6672973.1 right-handed parallel beta-helix repeat-containing protein [Devosia ginsengisoli]